MDRVFVKNQIESLQRFASQLVLTNHEEFQLWLDVTKTLQGMVQYFDSY